MESDLREQSLHNLLRDFFEESPLGDGVLFVDSHYTDVNNADHWHTKYSKDFSASTLPLLQKKYDCVIIRLPKSHTYFDFVLQVLSHYTNSDSTVYIYGKNDEGAKGAQKKLREFYKNIEVVSIKDRGRIIRCTDPVAANTHAKSSIEQFATDHEVLFRDKPHKLTYFPGMFALGKLDDATDLLLESILTSHASQLNKQQKGLDILDFACGSGIIAKILHNHYPAHNYSLLDSDTLSLESAKKNFAEAQRYILGDENLLKAGDLMYDLIVSNPPIHDGKNEQFDTLNALISEASLVLNKGGVLILVTQARIDLNDDFAKHFSHYSLLAETSRFKVWKGVTS